MSRVGTIVRVTEEHALIETTRRGVCDGCADHAKCAVEGAVASDRIENVLARNPIEAQPGDLVEFDLSGHAELKISLVVWVVPLIGLVAGAVLGANVHGAISLGRDVATLVGTALGGALAFGLVILIDRRARGSKELTPEVLKVVTPSGRSVASCIDDSSCGRAAGG